MNPDRITLNVFCFRRYINQPSCCASEKLLFNLFVANGSASNYIVEKQYEPVVKSCRTMDTRGIVGQIARIREQANLLIARELRERSIEGIVPAHGSVLHFLFQQSKPVPIKAVVENARRVKSTVTAMINKLERHGYVRKLPCETDNRITFVELTPKGRRLRENFDEISTMLLRQVYGDMNEDDREWLARQLEQIEQNLRAYFL